MKKIGFAIMLVLFASVSFLQAAQPAALVETDVLKKKELNDLQEFVGTVNFDKKSKIASESSGIAKNINFEVGQKVKKDEVLVQIDSDILDAQIKASRSAVNMYMVQLKNAKKNFERFSSLLEKKSIAQKIYDDSKLEYDVANENLISANAKLNELIIQKSKKQIKAPFSGVIVEKNINTNEWLNQGSQVATVVNTQDLEIIFNLPISFINGLKEGDIYDVDLSGQIIKAKLYAVILSGDKLTRTFPVRFKADIKDMFIFDGASANIKFAKETKSESLVINRDAVIKRFNMDVIFAVVENKAVMIPVKVSTYSGMEAAIVAEGIVEGMQVITKGNERVFPDMDVKVLNNSENK